MVRLKLIALWFYKISHYSILVMYLWSFYICASKMYLNWNFSPAYFRDCNLIQLLGSDRVLRRVKCYEGYMIWDWKGWRLWTDWLGLRDDIFASRWEQPLIHRDIFNSIYSVRPIRLSWIAIVDLLFVFTGK